MLYVGYNMQNHRYVPSVSTHSLNDNTPANSATTVTSCIDLFRVIHNDAVLVTPSPVFSHLYHIPTMPRSEGS